jgi:endonuclease/exonuclease/phosphatase family metal-dependent hydrolase
MLRPRTIVILTGAWLLLGTLGHAGQPQEKPLSPYAVCAHLSRGDEHQVAQEELKLMHQAGIGWVRADFDWSGVERRPGAWQFDHLDQTVAWAEAAGVRILPILDYDVPWARPAYKNLDKWLEYVRRVVTRYKDRIRYWEVWNEPNLEGFWHDKPNAADYTKLLKATYATIKQIDPELVVLLGGVSGIPWPYLEGIYEAGGKDAFDVMNVHPYRYPSSPEERPLYDDLVRLRQLMEKHGDKGKSIWITEVGWPTHQGRRGVSPERQAQMLARTYLLSLQAGVDLIFWYEFQAPEGRPDYNEDHFGIVHRDLSPKPAYTALVALARARPAGSKGLDHPWRSAEIYSPSWQRPDGKTAWALWTVGEAKDLELKLGGQIAEAFDHLGNPLTLRAESGHLRLSVGQSPVYLIGPTELAIGQGETKSPSQNPSPPTPLPASGARGERLRIGTKALRVKAMTFNIRYSAAADGPDRWTQRREMVADVIRRFDGDFVGIQEALPDQVAYLRESLPAYRLIVRSRLADPQQGEAVPLLYRHGRWRLDEKQQGTFWLSDTPEVPASTTWGNDIPRIVTWGRFVEGRTGRAVYVYNVHFDHASEPSRQKSAILLAQRIAGRAHPDPVILTGDFNCGESSYAIGYLKGEQDQSPLKLVDTFRVRHPDEKVVGTFHAFRGTRDGEKIDYVFALPGTKALDAEIVYFNRDGRYPSDHYPVTAEMVLPTPVDERSDR